MSNSYDSWSHAINIFLTRLSQFIFLSVVLSLLVWSALLHWYFLASWKEVARWTWGITDITEPFWRALVGLSMLAGVLMSGWLFTWLMLRVRLRSGDRYHRGSRVIHAEPKD